MTQYILNFNKGISGKAYLVSFANKGAKLKSVANNEVPRHIADFVLLDKSAHSKGKTELEFTELIALLDVPEKARKLRYTSKSAMSVRVVAEIDSPLADQVKANRKERARKRLAKKKPELYISNLQDLCDHFYADSPSDLNRRIYRDTNCGASISVRLENGEVWHNGLNPRRESNKLASVSFAYAHQGWSDLDINEPLHSFTIQTIVENSDATVDSDSFVVPVLKSDVDKWIEYMESEAKSLWDEANEESEDAEKYFCFVCSQTSDNTEFCDNPKCEER